MVYISVSLPYARMHLRQLTIKTEYFKHKKFVCIHKIDKFIVKVPGIDDNKISIFTHNGKYSTATITSQIETGKYLLDEEESNNEQLVFYYEDLIKQ